MSRRLEPVELSSASGEIRELLDAIEAGLGVVPNIHRSLAHSPAALRAYLGFNDALSRGVLPARLREQIALTVAEANHCEYSLALHCAAGRALGLSEEQLRDSRLGMCPERRLDELLRFAREVVEKRGAVADGSIQRLRSAGVGDGEIVEVVANAALYVFTNYFVHVARPVLDFSRAPELTRS